MSVELTIGLVIAISLLTYIPYRYLQPTQQNDENEVNSALSLNDDEPPHSVKEGDIQSKGENTDFLVCEECGTKNEPGYFYCRSCASRLPVN